MNAPDPDDPLVCINTRAAGAGPTCGEPDSEHCEDGCEMCKHACTCPKPAERRPVYADPDFGHEYDEDGEKDSVHTGWDLAFGCRVNFAFDGGAPYVSVSLSDQERRNGGCNRSVTREQIRAFAYHLIQMTDEMAEFASSDTTKETS